MLVLFINLGLMEFEVGYLILFLLFSAIGVFKYFKMGSLYKNIQLMLEFLKGPFFFLSGTLFLLFINDLPDDAIYNIAIYADDTTLYSKCDQASNLWQQLEQASELEFDLRETMDWAGSRLLVSMLEKLNWFYLIGVTILVLLM